MPDLKKGVIVGGGFAGLAAAYWFREQNSKAPLVLLERGNNPLSWLDRKGIGRITAGDASGPGTPLAGRYTRGVPELDRLLDGWTGSVNLDWLRSLGFNLQEDEEGTSFFCPGENLREAWSDILGRKNVQVITGYAVEVVSRQGDGTFRIWSREGDPIDADGLLLATGGERNHGLSLARELGHETVQVEAGYVRLRLANPRLGSLLGPADRKVGLKCMKSGIETSGLVTLSGRGIEGLAVSRMSAQVSTLWRQLNHKLKVEIDWLPDAAPGQVVRELHARVEQGGRTSVGDDALFNLNSRQWAYLLKQSKVDGCLTWGKIKPRKLQALAQQVKRSVISVAGAGLPQGERAWTGGIHPESVDWSSGMSTRTGNVWFAGEIMDFLGMPGGPHLNALWASAYQAGSSMGIALR